MSQPPTVLLTGSLCPGWGKRHLPYAAGKQLHCLRSGQGPVGQQEEACWAEKGLARRWGLGTPDPRMAGLDLARAPMVGYGFNSWGTRLRRGLSGRGRGQFPEPENNLASWHSHRNSLHRHSMEHSQAACTLAGTGRRRWDLHVLTRLCVHVHRLENPDRLPLGFCSSAVCL